MAMTSKERARTALQGGVPDKVPLGDFSIDADTVAKCHPVVLPSRSKRPHFSSDTSRWSRSVKEDGPREGDIR